jgi:hypothetical protein
MAIFEPVLDALDRRGVRFVVVGGVAVVLHGHPRLTVDLDLVIDLARDQAEAAVAALVDDLGLRTRLPVDPGDFSDPEIRSRWVRDRNLEVLSFHDPSRSTVEVDVFAQDPIPFEDLWRRSVVMSLGRLEIRVASIEDLIRMKRVSGRPQDRIDIEALEEIRERRSRRR